MQVKTIYDNLNKIYSFKNQTEWDCSGLINNKNEINKVLVCLDINMLTINFCIEHNIDLIISHHPLFIEPITAENFLARKNVGLLKKHNISAIYLHTPFDHSEHGMNHAFLHALNLINVNHSVNSNEYVVGELINTMTLNKFCRQIRKTFKLDFVKFNKMDGNKLIKTVGFCSGSGSSLIYNLNEKLDAFITCDTKYHTWIDASDLEISIIDINHNIENMFVNIISQLIYTYSSELKIFVLPSSLEFQII